MTERPDPPADPLVAPQALAAEDAKLVTLARSARVRTGAAVAAAVRDVDGRTYVAASVDLPSLRLDALQVAVAMAVSSGAPGLEAGAVVGPTAADVLTGPGAAAVRDLAGAGVLLVAAQVDGTASGSVRT